MKISCFRSINTHKAIQTDHSNTYLSRILLKEKKNTHTHNKLQRQYNVCGLSFVCMYLLQSKLRRHRYLPSNIH